MQGLLLPVELVLLLLHILLLLLELLLQPPQLFLLITDQPLMSPGDVNHENEEYAISISHLPSCSLCPQLLLQAPQILQLLVSFVPE